MRPPLNWQVALAVALAFGAMAVSDSRGDEGPDKFDRALEVAKSARSTRDSMLREQRLDEAQSLLRELISTEPKHPKIRVARNELATLLVQRAGQRVERLQRVESDERRKVLRDEARGMYEESLKLLAEVKRDLRGILESWPMPIDPKAPGAAALIAQRDQLRGDYLQVQLLLAAGREEMAETEPKESMEHKVILLSAADEYNEIYEKYRTRLAGLYARLYQSRCFIKMNDHKQALVYLSDLVDQPDLPEAFRQLKVRTLLLATECWFAATPLEHSKTIQHLDHFLSMQESKTESDPDLLALRLWLGKAYKARADALAASNPENREAVNKSLIEARRQIGIAAKHSSDVQNEARQLLPKLGGDMPEGLPMPATFDDAKRAGKTSLEAMQTAMFNVTELSKQVASETDALVKAALEKKLALAQEGVASNRADALQHYSQALRLANSESTIEELSVVQYFLSFLYYNRGDYFEAAVIGEFVARRCPESAGATQCAKIALASYMRLHKDSTAADKTFEFRRIQRIAEYIIAKWPKEPVAADAHNALRVLGLTRKPGLEVDVNKE